MPQAARQNDTNSDGGGQIIPQVTTVFINGLPASVVGDNSKPDRRCPSSGQPHCNPKTQTGSGSVFIEGLQAHRMGDKRICGATTNTGSPNVFIE